MTDINQAPLVSIICTVYNHAPYIRQCLDGFVMQQTTFPYEIIVHDDASTDNSAEIIREYADKYPGLFVTILQKENQYSKGVPIGKTFMYPIAKGKYIALCEGDDYWTDQLKLQKQVEWMEEHQDYVMCSSNAIVLTPYGTHNSTRYASDTDISVRDMILGGGGWIQTASLIVRKEILENYPECCQRCHVGDYPLQVYAVLTGKVRWLSEQQVVYRFTNNDSWTRRVNRTAAEILVPGWLSEIDMLSGLDELSNQQYQATFTERKVKFIEGIMKERCNEWKSIYKYFDQYIPLFDIKHKFYHFLFTHHMVFVFELLILMRQFCKNMFAHQ